MSADSESILNRKFMEFVKLLNIYLNHFPKHEKYALCNRIRNTAYEIYDLITEGQKRYYKKTTLTALDVAHEKLRMQLYLAYDMGYFKYKDRRIRNENVETSSLHRYATISSLVDELGRLIGGWIGKLRDDGRWK
jgi:four helix bundle protein